MKRAWLKSIAVAALGGAAAAAPDALSGVGVPEPLAARGRRRGGRCGGAVHGKAETVTAGPVMAYRE